MATGCVERFNEIISLTGRDTSGDPILDVPALYSYGYRPLISTLSGTIHAMLGIAHMIYHAAAIFFDFDDFEFHFYQIGVGAQELFRALVEMVPFVGNTLVFTFDLLRIKESLAADFMQRFPSYTDHWNTTSVAQALWRGEDLSGRVIVRDAYPPAGVNNPPPRRAQQAESDEEFHGPSQPKPPNNLILSVCMWEKYGSTVPRVEEVK